MEIFSLSGPSGTGKSTSALAFADQHKIPAIIDDGLLILHGQKIAGTSAKFEKNTVTAVRRAIFSDDLHAKEVQEALKIYVINKILIIGTSDKMTKLIAKRLELGDIDHYYYVEDIRSSSEIKMAQFIRKTEGKHIMPIPHKQVGQNFFKRLVYKGMDIFSPKKEKIGETTIVRPDFHKGYIRIEKKAFIDIIEHTCSNNPYIDHLDSIHVEVEGLPTANLNVSVVSPVSYHLPNMLEQLQLEIQHNFLHHFNIEFASIDVHVSSVGKTRTN
ncbi:hypothetical protein D1953_11525 [Peribacillus asahii]|uniref:Uncharacterized protein n=1 Tax=Peribacillus asahii TaxID=228899 RepID=A0A398B672_9BACI|nr:hypothetical protein [Peribacillus asahii]RID85435.1 hypothetical protein D1953_11525 [Peribacillus asahii]